MNDIQKGDTIREYISREKEYGGLTAKGSMLAQGILQDRTSNQSTDKEKVKHTTRM